MTDKHSNNKLESFFRKILVLSAVPAILIATAAFLLLPVVITRLDFGLLHVLEYIYVFYGIAIIVINRRAIGAWFKNLGRSIPFIRRMMEDKDFRFRVFLNWGAFISFLMLIFYLWAGYHYHSFWFYALAGYNFLVMVIRMVISGRDIRSIRKGFRGKRLELSQLRTFTWCGVAILVLNIAIGVMSMLMTFQNQYFPYNAFLIMSIAIFALYRFVAGFINARKFSTNRNQIFAASKNLDMIVGIMAYYTLQTTMLSLLREDSLIRFYANLVVGILVFIFNVVVALHMIYTGFKRIAEVKAAMKKG